MKDSLYIKEALTSASKEISLDNDTARNTLLTALSEANMSTNIVFTPVISAAIISKPKLSSTNIIATTAAGATVLTVGAINPTISQIDYSQAITNKPVNLIVELSTNMGVEEIYAQNELGNKYFGYYESGDYVIELGENGNYKVEVISDVGYKNSKQIVVSNIDRFGPTVSSYKFNGSSIDITYTDEMSKIDITSAYALINGIKVYPTTYDRNSNTVSYDFTSGSINVFINDELGNKSNYSIEK